MDAYMTMLKADSDGTEILGNRFCYGINFAEGCASPRQGSGGFINKNRASKAAGDWKGVNTAEGD